MQPLGQVLIERGLITPEDLANAHAIQREGGSRIGASLLRIGAIAEDELLKAVSEQVGLPILSSAYAPSDRDVRETAAALGVPLDWMVEHEVILWRPAAQAGGPLVCAAGANLHDPDLQEALEQLSLGPVQSYLGASAIVDPILIALKVEGAGIGKAGGADPAQLLELAEEAPVIDFVNAIMAEALALNASDIHFEPFEDKLLVRMRMDGVLSLRRTASRDLFDAVSSRIKLLSGMDIAESRLPQDGRQTIRIAGREVDIRVSTLPTTWGESIVVRLLGSTRKIPHLDALGLNGEQRAALRSIIGSPNGLVLVTGPTGSGKTTTVYRLISDLNDGVRKIVTIEDPVELDLPGVLQMTVRSDISLDFAAGLRSILRQDPDVIFVGEIRDAATAKTAIQAALTGHLVISTVHTNSALAAIPRLVDLGVEPFLLADVLRASVGQRLVRKLCPTCSLESDAAREETQATALLPDRLVTGAPRWRQARGCPACGGSGFQGRIGVFEVVSVGPDLQQGIRRVATESDLLSLARAQGFTTLLENGVSRARAGETAFSEILRVLGAVEP